MFGGVLAHVFRYLPGTEVRTAHRAAVRGLRALLRKRFIVEFAGGFGIERQIELIFPPELEARLRNRVVAVLRAGMAFGYIGGVGGDRVSDHAVLDVLLVR